MYYKKRNRSGIMALAIVIIACVIALAYVLWPQDSNIDNNITADSQVVSQEEDNQDYEEEPTDSQSNENINQQRESYYLLRNDNGIINIYFCDGNGNETFLEETDILYEVLSESDQATFDNGYQVESRDKLFNVLQNYES